MTTPIKGEPTHLDENNVERPGARDQLGVVNPTNAKDIEAQLRIFNATDQQRSRKSSQFPNVTDTYSPLDSLINEAIMLFGNMNPDTIQGNIRLMLLRRANSVIEDVRIHPYSTLPDIDYYVSLTDKRKVPDEIMIQGLAFHYAKWNKSSETKVFFAEYMKVLGQILYQRKFGSGKIQMNAIDRPEASE